MVGTFSGIFTLTTILVDKALYTKIWTSTDFKRITAKLIFAFSSLVTGHPRGFYIALPLVLVISVKLLQLRRNFIRKFHFSIAVVLMLEIVLVQIFEITAKSSGRIRFGAGTLFDFFNLSE